MPANKVTTPEQDEEIVRLLKIPGMSVPSVAEKMALSIGIIHRRAKLSGLNQGHSGRPAPYRKCLHWWGVSAPLQYPDGTRYGTRRVCVRCRARCFVYGPNADRPAGVEVLPPMPMDKFPTRTGEF